MEEKDKQRIINRYNERLTLYGDDIRTLASGTDERRRLRFKILSGIGIFDGVSVLDVGCGFGDLYSYLNENNYEVDYTGYDINSELLSVARRKYPSVHFEEKDIQMDTFPEFDYIVSTSAFNLKLETVDNYEYIGEIMNICHEHCRHGVAIDLMSSYVDYETAAAFHYSPEKVFSMAKSISKRVCLRHDYPLYEFCIYLYK